MLLPNPNRIVKADDERLLPASLRAICCVNRDRAREKENKQCDYSAQI
jgi:hypothetical protein